jgi:anti-sigma-K factor RskA
MSTERDRLDTLAGEYVLGLLSEEERREFEAEAQADPAARKALGDARERLSEFDLTAPAAPTPAGLWERIEAGLDRPDNVVPLRRSSPAPHPGSGLKFWHGFAAAIALAAVGFAAFQSLFPPSRPQLIVVLLDAQSQPGAIIEAYAGESVRVVPLTQIDVPEGKTLQVWTLPSPQIGPVSVGLLEEARATTLTGFDLPPPRPQQLYEITLEQAGGSPTGRPTGPIIAKGFAKEPQI